MLRPIKNVFAGTEYPDLLVGLDDPDDAAVWHLDEGRALVVTTDFFTPVVDDPYDYGAIAAANSLSDIYAMGAQPFMALNVAGLPPKLPPEIGAEIMRGGAEKAFEAGVVIAGGHTVQDEEPKYGLIALGFVDPAKAITNGGAQVGDQLVLTKPLGFGTTTTALKQGKATDEDVAEVVDWMKRLNKVAAELAVAHNVRGGTDVTGFSLLGHAAQVAAASSVGLRLDFAAIPLVSGARKYAAEFIFPGGAHDNKAFYGEQVRFADHLSEDQQLLLFDPQTSGGLLLAVPADQFDDFMAQAKARQQPVWRIGEVVAGAGIDIV